MVRTTIYLPAELKRRIERLARERRTWEAEVIRAALNEYTTEHPAASTHPLIEAEPVDDWDAAMRGFGGAEPEGRPRRSSATATCKSDSPTRRSSSSRVATRRTGC